MINVLRYYLLLFIYRKNDWVIKQGEEGDVLYVVD
jgi:hypothetical protein